MAFTCPVCHKDVKDLRGHVRRQHTDQYDQVFPGETIPAADPTAGDPPAGVNHAEHPAKDLELANIPKQETKENQSYHCVECGASVIPTNSECPNCGTPLDWKAVLNGEY